MRSILFAASAAALLSACATGAERPSYSAELETLRAECEERGGILTFIGATMTAYPRADYACRMQNVNFRARG